MMTVSANGPGSRSPPALTRQSTTIAPLVASASVSDWLPFGIVT
jgi:hypothetical protein